MRHFFLGIIAFAAIGSIAAVGAEAPLVMREFNLNADQQQRFQEMARLKTEYDKIAAPYEKEVDAWIQEASRQQQKSSDRRSGIDWRLERKQLLIKLEDIQARKNPRIEQLDQQIESIIRGLMKEVPADKK